MSHSNGRIYIDTSGTTPIGIDPLADVSYVLGRATGDVGQLCGDVKWDSTNQQWVRANSINPCALWKPFQYPAKAFASITEQRNAAKSVGGGFRQYDTATGFPTFAPSSWSMTSHNTWTYYPPTGGTLPYRLLDFAPPWTLDGQVIGYRHDAPSPVGVEWPHFESSYPVCVVHVGSASYGTGGGTWDRYNCLSFDDLFPASGAYGSYHFALLMQRNTFRTMVVSSATVANIETSSYAGSAAIPFAKGDCTALSNLSPGDVVNCCICLVQYTATTIPTGESVVLNESSPNFPGTATSLELKANSDRAAITFTGYGSIANMVLNNVSISATKQSSSDIANHTKYKINSISFSAGPGTGWNYITSVEGVIEIRLSGGMLKHDGTGTITGASMIYGDSQNKYALAISASSSTSTYSYVFGNTIGNASVPFDLYAYVPTTASSLTLELYVSFSYDVTKQGTPWPATQTLTR